MQYCSDDLLIRYKGDLWWFYQGTKLQKELKEEEEAIKELDTNLKKAQSRYTVMYEKMQGKVDKTEVSLGRRARNVLRKDFLF